MATKEEILSGIREVEARLERLLPAALDRLQSPLLEGTWTVHDALCHMAADVPAVPRWLTRLEAAEKGISSRPPGFNIDEYNQKNIDQRKSSSIEAIVQEIRDGLHADSEAVAAMEPSLLQKQITNFRGEIVAASEQLRFTTVGHNHLHLEDIERAVAPETSSSKAGDR